MTLEAIKQAITELPEDYQTSLAAWLAEQDAKAWDKQIEEDFSEGGAGMALLEAWDAEIRAGGSVSLEEFLAQRPPAHKAECCLSGLSQHQAFESSTPAWSV